MNFKLIRRTSIYYVMRHGHSTGARSKQPRGTRRSDEMRTPISDVISDLFDEGAIRCDAARSSHRRTPCTVDTSHNTHGSCSWAMSSPSVAAHTKTNRDHPPTPPTQTQTETPQTRAVAAPDTLVHSNPIGRRTPTTWSAHPRSPTISHNGSRARTLLGLESAPTISFGTCSA